MSMKSTDAFRTISEVAEELDLPQHVLRFWETRFSQIRPMKRGGGRRYYRPDDVELLKGIRYLLYVKGFTIKGVQRILRENGNRFVVGVGAGDVASLDAMPAVAGDREAGEVEIGVPEDTEGEAEPEIAPASASPVGERRSGFTSFLRRDRGTGGDEAPVGLPRESVATLQDVLIELLECKRLLDQSR
ncbi:MerR family transcriptional regulator [Aureimonas leprariae]|uniref:MerR family transcriptional regulator n=1 Tax=Plantimonas leprariae TaxID=2615207 RepID=A0A7V7PQS0_9HYPH|nr:MerR family transcriptional regulator [Aureimonas leprariae]KAB0680720.1 MerR family transcriptional regulator [Aureimonas leprariae]